MIITKEHCLRQKLSELIKDKKGFQLNNSQNQNVCLDLDKKQWNYFENLLWSSR